MAVPRFPVLDSPIAGGTWYLLHVPSPRARVLLRAGCMAPNRISPHMAVLIMVH